MYVKKYEKLEKLAKANKIKIQKNPMGLSKVQKKYERLRKRVDVGVKDNTLKKLLSSNFGPGPADFRQALQDRPDRILSLTNNYVNQMMEKNRFEPKDPNHVFGEDRLGQAMKASLEKVNQLDKDRKVIARVVKDAQPSSWESIQRKLANIAGRLRRRSEKLNQDDLNTAAADAAALAAQQPKNPPTDRQREALAGSIRLMSRAATLAHIIGAEDTLDLNMAGTWGNVIRLSDLYGLESAPAGGSKLDLKHGKRHQGDLGTTYRK